MAVARLTLTRIIRDNVLSMTTKVVDAIPEDSINSVEYLITMKKGDRTFVKTLKLVAHRTDTGTIDTVFSKLGNLNVSATVQLNLGYVELLLQNNEAFDVSISAVRAIA